MKKLTFLIALACIFSATVISQPCLYNGITFTHQNEIDMFKILYPNCTEIMGNVEIGKYNCDITSLSGLDCITLIGESLTIGSYGMGANLESLYGLHNLTSIGNTLMIFGTGGLEDLSGLEGLTSVGNIMISSNNALTNLKGIEGVDSCDNIYISHNHNLTSLIGLDSLKYIKEKLNIYDNLGLTNLIGLDALTHVGHTLIIWSNHFMTNLSGLDNLDLIDGNLKIIDNSSLSDLESMVNIEASAIDTLFIYENPSLSVCNLNFICEYLSENGYLAEIYGNAPGCNSPEEVLDSCVSSSICNIPAVQITSLHPNPFTTCTTIEFELTKPSSVQLIIYDYLGKQIEVIEKKKTHGKQQIVWNADGLPAGIYFYTLKADEQVATGKMVKMR